MLEQAAVDLGVSLTECYMVGDRSQVLAAARPFLSHLHRPVEVQKFAASFTERAPACASLVERDLRLGL